MAQISDFCGCNSLQSRGSSIRAEVFGWPVDQHTGSAHSPSTTANRKLQENYQWPVKKSIKPSLSIPIIMTIKDEAKALRVILDFAMTDGDEEVLFKKVRCLRCGSK